MNYISQFKNLISQASKCINYKRIPVFFRILCFILALPFILTSFSIALIFLLFYTLYRLSSAGCDYLYEFIYSVGKQEHIKHATQFLVYLIGFPTIFMLKSILALFINILYFVYFMLSISLYYATLGGITFHPFIKDQYAPINYSNDRMCFLSYLVFILVNLILIVVGILEVMYLDVMICFIVIFSLIYIPLVFRKKVLKLPKNGVEIEPVKNVG